MGQKRGRRPGRITVHADRLSVDQTVNVVPRRGTVQQIVSITTENTRGPVRKIQFKLTDGAHSGFLGNGTYPTETFLGHRGGAVITYENYLSLSFPASSASPPYHSASAFSGELDTATYNVVLMEV
ncbi:MAG: hypothetical protein HKP30_09365 [Myxococcales bacterium]|nr:hypothetical protein [Myxococcales bacterium]